MKSFHLRLHCYTLLNMPVVLFVNLCSALCECMLHFVSVFVALCVCVLRSLLWRTSC